MGSPEESDDSGFDPEAPVELPLDGNLDLPVFHPRDVKDVVTEYLWACRQKGVLDVRIIHGKGTGALRAHVRKLLESDRRISVARPGELFEGGTGVTVVEFA